MASHKRYHLLHASLTVVFLIAAIIAYSLGFAKNVGALLIGGIILEVGFWVALYMSTRVTGQNGS